MIEVERYRAATSQIAQTTLRSVLGKADLDMLLSERERLNEALQQIIDEQTDPWGIKVTTVEIKDVGIPQGMQRAMARQAEAERERRAKVINAEGEFQASERLYDAAQIMSANPTALQLRYLQTLLEIGSSQTSTIVFPLPDRPPQAAAPGHPVRRHGEAPAATAGGRRHGRGHARGGQRRARDRRRRRAGTRRREELDAEVEAELEAQAQRVKAEVDRVQADLERRKVPAGGGATQMKPSGSARAPRSSAARRPRRRRRRRRDLVDLVAQRDPRARVDHDAVVVRMCSRAVRPPAARGSSGPERRASRR